MQIKFIILDLIIEAYKEQGDKVWENFNSPPDKRMWFYEEVLKILKERLDNEIVKEFEKVYSEAKELFK